MTKKQTFEDFLADRCPSELQTNNSPEGQENWIERLDVQELIDFGESYGEIMFLQGEKAGLERGKEIALDALQMTQHND